MANRKSYEYLSQAYDKKWSKQYDNFADDYDNFADDYSSYHPTEKTSYNFNIKPYDITPYEHKSLPSTYDDIEANYKGKRGGLDRAFDVLQIGQYVTAGAVQGMVDENLDVLEGMWGGLKAANPFGKGYEEGEHSYSRVLETSGWKPETTGGKIARGVVGFVGDVMLDPMTYFSGGIKPLITGTGKLSAKVALKGANVVDKLGDSAKFIDTVSDVNKGLKMTQDVAEGIVKSSKIAQTGEGVIDVAVEGKRLMNRYNDLLGFANEVNSNIVWSLSNAPFGKRLFGKYADKSVDIISNKWLQEAGDMGLANLYAPLRDKIFGSKIGQKFSVNHPVYQLAKTNPEKVYTDMKFIDTIAGLEGNKITNKLKIQEQAKKLMGMTPAETDEMIKLMEDKTVWSQVKKTFKFFDTKEANVYKAKMEDARTQAKTVIKELKDEATIKFGNDAYKLNSSIDAVKKNKISIANDLNMENINKLLEVDINYLKTVEDITDYVNELQKATNSFEYKVFDVEVDDIEYLVNRNEIFKGLNVKEKDSVLLRPKLDESIIKGITKPKDMPSSTFSKFKADIKKNGYKEYRSLSYADKAVGRLDVGWQKVQLDNGKVRIYPPRSVPKTGVSQDITAGIGEAVTKQNMIDDLSTYLFGKTGWIKNSTYDGRVSDVVDAIAKGGKEEGIEYILKNTGWYNGKMSEMYSFIAHEIGYGTKTKFPTFDDYYIKRINSLDENITNYATSKGIAHDASIYQNSKYAEEALAKEQYKLYTELKRDNLTREYLKHQFKDAQTYDDVIMIKSAINSEKMNPKAFASSVDRYAAEVELDRLKFVDDTIGDALKKGSMSKSYHKKDTVAVNFEIPKDSKQELMTRYSKVQYETPLEQKATIHKKMAHITDDIITKEIELSKLQVEFDKLNKFTPTDVLAKEFPQYKALNDKINITKASISRQRIALGNLDKEIKIVDSQFAKINKNPNYKRLVEQQTSTNKAIVTAQSTVDAKKIEVNTLINKLDELNAYVPTEKVTINGKSVNVTDTAYLADKAKTNKLLEIAKKELIEGKQALTLQTNRLNNLSNGYHFKEKERMDRVFPQMEYLMENIWHKEFGQLDELEMDKVYRWASSREWKISNGKDIDILNEEEYHALAQKANKQTITKIKEAVSTPKAHDGSDLRRNHKVQIQDKNGVYEAVIEDVSKYNGKNSYTVIYDGKPHYLTDKDIVKGIGEIPPKNLDELRMQSHMLDDFVTKGEDRIFQMTKVLEELVPTKVADSTKKLIKSSNEFIDTLKQDKIKAITGNIEYNIEEVDNILMDLSNKKIEFVEKGISYDMDSITYFEGRVKKLDQLLTDADAFDNYIMNMNPYGQLSSDAYEEIAKKYDPKIGKYMLNEELDISPILRENTNWLREQFLNIGDLEVGVNKLKQGQVDANMLDYIPHVLTKEGENFFSKSKEDIGKKLPGFGSSDGFGREFNPFAQSRTITSLPDGKGGFINKPGIQQINDFFREANNGKDVMRTDLSDIYLARALKHNDLMYDNKYMNNMLDRFGEDYVGEILEGHSVAMNYGKLKAYSKQISSQHASIDMSEMVSEHMSNPDLIKRMEDIAHQLNRKAVEANIETTFSKQLSEVRGREYNKFITDNFTKEFKKNLYDKTLKEFTDATGVERILDEVGLPMSKLDDAQIVGMNKARDVLDERFAKHIRLKVSELMKLDPQVDETGAIINKISETVDKMSMDEIHEFLVNASKTIQIDEDVVRLQKLLDKSTKYKELLPPQVKQVQESIMENANRSRKLAIMKDQSRFLKVYDTFTHFIKVNQTAVLPAFHGRNKMSNTFNNWLVIGQDATNPTFQKKVMKAMQAAGGKAGVADELFEMVVDGRKTMVDGAEIMRMAEAHGLIGSGQFAADIGVNLSGKQKGILSKLGVKGKFDPTDMNEFIPYKVGMKVGTSIENHDKLIHFASQLKNGMSYADAAKSAQRSLFDYSALTEFESSVMKRIFPYYTWLRKNGQYQLEMMLEAPEKYRMVAKVLGGIRGMVDEDDQINMDFVNEFAKDWVQTPFNVINPKGKTEPVLLNPNLPFMDIGRLPNPLDPINSAKEMFTQMNPLFKVPIELGLNHNAFFESPIAKESENRVLKSLEYVVSQMGLYQIGKGAVQKKDSDLALHALGNTTGIKLLSYDYDTYKPMKILEIMDDMYQKRKLEAAMKKLASDGISIAKGAIDSTITDVADVAYNGRPLRPDEYTNALRPITETTYQSLSDEEKKLYTPPREEDAMRYSAKAVELEEAALQATGKAQKFIWTMIEDFDMGSRNEPYKFVSVSEVIDGDTIKVNLDGRRTSIRVLLLDTPETSKVNEDGETYGEDMPFGQEATQFAKDKLFGKDVKLYFDTEEKDMYDRTLAYIEVDGVDYAESAIESGMGQFGYQFAPTYKRKDDYAAAQQRAYQEKSGIWSLDGYAQPDGEAEYSSQVTMGDYDDWKRNKINELSKKKSNMKINANPMDNILKQLRK